MARKIRVYKCVKCGRVTSTTNPQVFKQKLCPRCRVTPARQGFFAKLLSVFKKS